MHPMRTAPKELFAPISCSQDLKQATTSPPDRRHACAITGDRSQLCPSTI